MMLSPEREAAAVMLLSRHERQRCTDSRRRRASARGYMALTENNMAMIRAIAMNDIPSARDAALASLAEDKSKKNAAMVRRYRAELRSGATLLMPAMPKTVQNFLVGVMPHEFNKAVYYVRENDSRVAMEIMAMRAVAKKWDERGVSHPNTALFYGESGTGKTMLAHYIAHTLDLPLFYVSYAPIIGSYMGETAGRIHDVFEFCKSFPCILMLDEIDCIAVNRSKRGGEGANGELERTTISLMQELDALPNHVTVIAATNRLDMMDAAVLRRFTTQYEVTKMFSWEMEAMMRQFIRATKTEGLADDATIRNIANNAGNPGRAMTELMRVISIGLYSEAMGEISARGGESADAETETAGMWEVTYTWRKPVYAETRAEAIAKATVERRTHAYSGAVRPSENYAAVLTQKNSGEE